MPTIDASENRKPKTENVRPIPPPIPIIDTEAFRRRLAGLVDPLGPRGGPATRGHLKETASRLCVVLADLYDVSDTDRTSLWEHIAKALRVADERTTDNDIERFVSECLAVVKADPARAPAHDGLSSLVLELAGWPDETRHDFLAYLRTHLYVVLTFGRVKWEEHKAASRARRDAARQKGGGDADGERA